MGSDTLPHQRCLRISIRKAFIDDKQPDSLCQHHQLLRRIHASVRIVRVHHNGKIASLQSLEGTHLLYAPTTGTQCGGVFIIGRGKNRSRSCPAQARDHLYRSLCPSDGHDFASGAICVLRGTFQLSQAGGFGQALPGIGGYLAYGIRHGIDAGRQVDPIRQCAAIVRGRLPNISSVVTHSTSSQVAQSTPTQMRRQA